MERLLGLSKLEILGKSDAELFGEATAQPIQQTDQQVLRGENYRGEDCFEVQGQLHVFSVVKTPYAIRRAGSAAFAASPVTSLRKGRLKSPCKKAKPTLENCLKMPPT
jgi:hypothetical protein